MADDKPINDIEDEGLAEAEQTPLHFWEKKQRELVLSVVDYNLSSLSDLIDSKTINLSPKYQRRFRWDKVRQSRLIESFLMNVPVPPIFLNEDQYGKYSVIDGKQRLTAIHSFIRGQLRMEGLTVFNDINDKTLEELDIPLQEVIKVRPTLRAIIILRQSDQDIKFEVFKRLNTGGVTLNAQEIRNSTYPGPLNDLILELSEHPLLHSLLGIKSKSKSRIYLEMRDAEFVLRYFTFRTAWENFESGMKLAMDRFMAQNQRTRKSHLSELENDFLATLKVVEAGFGEHAFRRWIPDKESWRKPVLAALYDAQMFACRGLDAAELRENRDAILRGYQALFSSDEFRQNIDSATNTPSYFTNRIRLMKQLLVSV